jgi:hypothetical protein
VKERKKKRQADRQTNRATEMIKQETHKNDKERPEEEEKNLNV